MKIQIERVADNRFDVLIDGRNSGQYETEKKAKAGARRFFPPNMHVKWHLDKNGLLFGIQKHWTRKIGQSF